jgi:hypothetical protein
MRPFIFILCLCAIAIYAWTPAAEARGRNAGGCRSCDGGTCEVPQQPAQQPAKAWPWSKPTPPAPAPSPEIALPVPPAPIVAPVAPCAPVDEMQADGKRKPLRRIVAFVARGVAKAGRLICPGRGRCR